MTKKINPNIRGEIQQNDKFLDINTSNFSLI